MAFKRRLRFDKRIKFRKSMSIMYILLFVVLASLGVGYSYIKSNLNINGTANVTAANWDVHFANLNVTTGSVTASSPANITNTTTVEFAATLDEPEEFYEFTVDIVNNGTIDAMIDDYSIRPTLTTAQKKYLEYTVAYSDGVPLEYWQELKQGTTETLKVRFMYKKNDNTANYPTEDQSLNIVFTINYIQADGNEIPVKHPVSFADDSWPTIITAIQNGNTSNYNVGDTKTVDMGTFGTHTIRIANKSTPAECSTTGFSKTACGFVLEFEDIIIDHNMNSSTSNVGGWPTSAMRTFVNNDIYNALPAELQNGIIDTEVISGHGMSDSNNFISMDRLYLLSPHEVWNDVDGNTNSGIDYYDTAYNNTRQLDYYQNQGVTTSNYSGAIKQYNGSEYNWWWLRSACLGNARRFSDVSNVGGTDYSDANTTLGLSPAFRIVESQEEL